MHCNATPSNREPSRLFRSPYHLNDFRDKDTKYFGYSHYIIWKFLLFLHILLNPVSCGADGLLGDAHDADDLASFLCITPQMLSKIRKNISFGAQK